MQMSWLNIDVATKTDIDHYSFIILCLALATGIHRGPHKKLNKHLKNINDAPNLRQHALRARPARSPPPPRRRSCVSMVINYLTFLRPILFYYEYISHSQSRPTRKTANHNLYPHIRNDA